VYVILILKNIYILTRPNVINICDAPMPTPNEKSIIPKKQKQQQQQNNALRLSVGRDADAKN